MSFLKKHRKVLNKAVTIGLTAAGIGIGGYLLYKALNKNKKKEEKRENQEKKEEQKKQDDRPAWFPRWGGSNRALIRYHSTFVEELQDYNLKFFLTGKVQYYGHLTLNFTIKKDQDPQDVYINSKDLRINKLVVNGKQVGEKDLKDLVKPFFIKIKAEVLKKGENEVVIAFDGFYGAGNHGFTQFFDKDDNKYLVGSSDFYSNYSIFPCFEQHNFRGRFRVSVIAPEDWTVGSCCKGSSKMTGEQARQEIPEFDELGAPKTAFEKTKFWKFNQSKSIPSSMLGLIAGNYQRLESKHRINHKKIAIYYAKDRAKYVERMGDEFFEIIKILVKEYEALFGIKYPFGKLEIALYPETGVNSEMKSTPGLIYFQERYMDWGAKFNDHVLIRRIALSLAKVFLSNLFGFNWWLDKSLVDNLAKYAALVTVTKIHNQYKRTDKFNFLVDYSAEMNLMAFHTDYINRTNKFKFTKLGKDLDEIIDPLSEGFLWNYNFINSSYNKVSHLFSFYPEDFFKKFMTALVEKYAWKSLNEAKLVAELKAQAQKSGLNFPQKSDPADFIQDLFFRPYFGVIFVEIKNGTIDVTQAHSYYTTKFIPLSFNISFFNANNEIVNVQKIHMPAIGSFSVPLEISDYEYYVVNSDLRCHCVFDYADEENVKKLYARFLDIPMPAQCQAFKGLFFRFYFKKEYKEEFQNMALQIAENFDVMRVNKFLLSIRSPSIQFGDETGKEFLAKMFDIIRQRITEEDEFAYYCALDHFKKRDYQQLKSVVDIFDSQNAKIQLKSEPPFFDLRQFALSIYDIEVDQNLKDRILKVIKEGDLRIYNYIKESLMTQYDEVEIDRILRSIVKTKLKSKNDVRKVFLKTLSVVSGIYTIRKFLDMSGWMLSEVDQFVDQGQYMKMLSFLGTFCPFDTKIWRLLALMTENLRAANAPFFIVRYIEKQLILRKIIVEEAI